MSGNELSFSIAIGRVYIHKLCTCWYTTWMVTTPVQQLLYMAYLSQYLLLYQLKPAHYSSWCTSTNYGRLNGLLPYFYSGSQELTT